MDVDIIISICTLLDQMDNIFSISWPLIRISEILIDIEYPYWAPQFKDNLGIYRHADGYLLLDKWNYFWI